MHSTDLMPKGFDINLHVPSTRRPMEVLVAVHGISRGAREIFSAFRQAAGDRMIVVAPLFSKDAFPDYQRLGLGGRGYRADLVLEAALDRIETATGHSMGRIHLFGFSGGAQFAHRFAMLYPDRIASLHVASAGWYTFPDPNTDWPYGLGKRSFARAMASRLAHFRSVPTTVYVGAKDTERDAALRTGRLIDRQQGLDRVERAHAWASAVGNTEVIEVPNAGHSFEDCTQAGDTGLCDLVLQRIASATQEAQPFALAGE